MTISHLIIAVLVGKYNHAWTSHKPEGKSCSQRLFKIPPLTNRNPIRTLHVTMVKIYCAVAKASPFWCIELATIVRVKVTFIVWLISLHKYLDL